MSFMLTFMAAALQAQTNTIPQAFADDITKLLRASKGKETMTATMGATYEQLAGQLNLTAEQAHEMAAFIVGKIYPKVEVRMVELYARLFTHEEVKQILAFYATPAGSKLAGQSPEIAAEGAKIGASMTADIQAAVLQYMSQKK